MYLKALISIAATITLLFSLGNSFAQQRSAIKTVTDCAVLMERQIDKQANARAAALVAQCAGKTGVYIPPAFQNIITSPITTYVIKGPSVESEFTGSELNLVTGDETFPGVTQAGSMIWGSGDTVVSVYNDTSGAENGSFSGMSVSIDGAINFERLDPNPFDTTFMDDIGSPAVAYDKQSGKWLALALSADCGGQGIGLFSSSTPSFTESWAVESCPHSGLADDRPIIWVDNNEASGFYGRRYISFNDFDDGGALKLLWSIDGGSWTEVIVDDGLTTGFIRNVHITGSMETDGTVFIFGMDENGGADANRQNWVYRSLDGGATWGSSQVGPGYPAAGAGLCSGSDYFYMMPPVWRHMGWGQGAVGPGGIIHYVYARAGSTPDDLGDIYYMRSTDNGANWVTSNVPLNTDAINKNNVPQWQPSISVTEQGNVLVGWYDRRNTTDGLNYQYYGRLSLNNGASFLPDEPISSVIIPQPSQLDPAKSFCFAGNSNFHSSLGSASLTTWTDGRNAIATQFPTLLPEEQMEAQMDVYFKRVNLCPPISIDPPVLPNGELALLYDETVTASGGTSPYTFSRFSLIPDGLALDPVSGQLTGIPNATGVFPFTIKAIDAFGCDASQAYRLVVDPDPASTTCPLITLSPLDVLDGAQGAPYLETVIATGGSAPYSYLVTAGDLPLGVTLDAETGDIIGVPQESGDFNFSITAADADDCTGTQSYGNAFSCPMITLSPPAPNHLPDAAAGFPYLQNITANGGTAPYKFFPQSATPKGIFYAEGGTMFGVTEKGGTKNTAIVAQDINGCEGEATFRLDSKNCPPGAIFCDSSVNVEADYTATNQCGDANNWYKTQGCPSSDDIGHTPSAHARWGVPEITDEFGTVIGPEDCGLYGVDGAGTQDTLESDVFDVSNCNSGEVLLNFNYLLGVGDDATSDRVRVEVASDGGAVEVIADNGAGGPTCSGLASPGIGNLKHWSGWQHLELKYPVTSSFQFNFVAETDTTGFKGGEGFYVDDVVLQCACPVDFILTPEVLPNATQNVGYVEFVVAEGGLEPYIYGTLPGVGTPPGLSLDSETGALVGTPTTPGIFNFTIEVTDDNACQIGNIYNLLVSPENCPVIDFSPLALDDGTEGTFYSAVPEAVGGTEPYNYVLTEGELPPGLSLNAETGVITGTPTAAGIYPFTLSVVDGVFCTSSLDYNINIMPASCPIVTVSPETLPEADTRFAYSEFFTGDGGEGPYLWSVTEGVLPSGMSLDTGTGEIFGQPASGGSFPFDITAQDINLCLGTQPYTLEVFGCPVISLAPSELPNAVNGVAYSESVAADGGVGPYVYTVSSGSLPPGVTLDPVTGELSGIPDSNGIYSFDISAADANNCIGIESYTVIVSIESCPTIAIAPDILTPLSVGTSYSQPLVASGGLAPYAYSVLTGTLPGGLVLNPATGEITGTADTYGTFPFEILALDTNACIGVKSYTLEDRSCSGIEDNKIVAANFGPGMHLCVGTNTLTTSGDISIDPEATVFFQSPATTLNPTFNVNQPGVFRVGPVENVAPIISGPDVLNATIGDTLDFTTTHSCEDFEDGVLDISPADSGELPGPAGPQLFTLSCTDSDGITSELLLTVIKE